MNGEGVEQDMSRTELTEWAHRSGKPLPMTTITLTIHSAIREDCSTEAASGIYDATYEGTVLDYDESGDFALIVWEDGTRDYRYIHKGYDAEMNETMEWDV